MTLGAGLLSRIDSFRSEVRVECAAMSLSRRDLLRSFLRPIKAGRERLAPSGGGVSPLERTDQVAVIQARHCLAYQQRYCSRCYEQCPVPHAIELDDGLPRIILEVCTGCGICHDVCPAPENAVLITERRPGFGA